MSIYLELPAVAVVVVYIVGVSGFTHSWRSFLSRLVGIRESELRPLRPFDCPACMTWWVCLAYGWIMDGLDLWIVLESAVLSLCSIPIQDFLLLVREGLSALMRNILERL